MEQYYFMALFFPVGYAIGRISSLKAVMGIRKENNSLNKEALVLKNHIASSKKGRIIIQGEDSK